MGSKSAWWKIERFLMVPHTTMRIRKRLPGGGATGWVVRSRLTRVSMVSNRSGFARRLPSLERSPHQALLISSSALTTALLASFFAPSLLVFSLPATIWVIAPVARDAWRRAVLRGSIGVEALNTVFLFGAVITANLLAAALAAFTLSLGKWLLNKVESKSQKSIANVFRDLPRDVWLIKDEVELQVPIDSLKKGDIIVVSSGETIPADGTVIEGWGTVDQMALTGEFKAAEKGIGDEVYSSTLLVGGKIRLCVERTGTDTLNASVLKVLDRTTDYKDKVREEGQRIADRSALPTMVLGFLSFPIVGASNAVAVFNSCWGLKMRMLGPLGLLTYLNRASRDGILFKDGRALQLLDQVDTVVFDKTGTLTLAEPAVSGIHSFSDDVEENAILLWAASLEIKQSHPIARSIVQEAEDRGLELWPVAASDCHLGLGVSGSLRDSEGREVTSEFSLGSRRFMEMRGVSIPAVGYGEHIETGETLIYIAQDSVALGTIRLRAEVRPEAYKVLQALRKRGFHLHLLSGDHEAPTRRMAEDLGFESYQAGVLPTEKAEVIKQLQNKGRSVCFIGDGINDAVALKQANVSVSTQGASMIATDVANVVLLSGDLQRVAELFEIAESYRLNLRTSYWMSVIPGVVTICGVFFLHFGIIHSIILNNLGLTIGVGNSLAYKRSASTTKQPAQDWKARSV